MGTIDGLHHVSASRKSSGILYPVMLIAAIAVIVFSIVGIATMTGVMPRALSSKSEQASPEEARDTNSPAATPMEKPSKAHPATTSSLGAGTEPAGRLPTVASWSRSVPAGRAAESVLWRAVWPAACRQSGGRGPPYAMTVAGAGAGAHAGHEIEKTTTSPLTIRSVFA
jgi:hypothetical protein